MTRPERKERRLLTRFLSVYERDAWANAELDWLDEREQSAVEVKAVRPDGVSLAIEHTLVQPNATEKADYAKFAKVFRTESRDATLDRFDRYLYLDVPQHTLMPGDDWDAIAADIFAFIRTHKHTFPDDRSIQDCQMSNGKIAPLMVRSVPARKEGRTLINRYGTFDVEGTVTTALRRKLPKLLGTEATHRVLMLERDQMRLDPTAIAAAVQSQRPNFAGIDLVHVWVAETWSEDIALFEPLRFDDSYSPVYSFSADTLQWRDVGW